MKSIFKILLVTLLVFFSVNMEAQRTIWSTGTANTMGKADIQIAALQPSAYGLSESADIYIQPFVSVLAPNISLKKNWLKKTSWSYATKHGVVYPTPLLKYVVKNEYLEALPLGTAIPDVIVANSEFLVSYGWGASTCSAFTGEKFNPENTFRGNTNILTLKLGLQTGFNSDSFPVVNEPLIFQRSYYYNNNLSFYAGLDLDGHISTYLDYFVDLDYIYFDEGYYALEHKGMIKWFLGKKFFHLLAGYHLSYANTPDGAKFFAGPMIDLVWVMHRKKMNMGLFNKKMF